MTCPNCMGTDHDEVGPRCYGGSAPFSNERADYLAQFFRDPPTDPMIIKGATLFASGDQHPDRPGFNQYETDVHVVDQFMLKTSPDLHGNDPIVKVLVSAICGVIFTTNSILTRARVNDFCPFCLEKMNQ